MTVRQTKSAANSAYEQGARIASQLRSRTQLEIARWSPAGTTYDQIGSYVSDLLVEFNVLGDVINTPEVNAAAQAAEGDPTYNFTGELTTLRGLMVDVKDRILNDVPATPVTNWREVVKFNSDGSLNWRLFSATALTNLLADMQLIVDQIDAP